jgi:uncharacterized membrane protein YfcA
MAVAETPNATDVRTEKGISLARGPALILGTILLAAGLYFLYREHTFPPFSDFPNGKAPVEGKVFGIFGANGWTGMLTAIAGGLLLFGAAQHLLAKTMSLIVGVALGAAAIIALISGNVLGLAAANGWTELAWGIAAVILLFNTLVPRRRKTVPVEGRERRTVGRRGRADAAPAAVEAGEERRAEERAADRDPGYGGNGREREYAAEREARADTASNAPGEDRAVGAGDPAVDGGDTSVATRERPPGEQEGRA